ncbi:TrkA family potassium uptake protein [Clostridium sp. YIM B02515]|uniref:TrkA family potassium uptake protein n=1 Tax=Clostridium rhizosphaerae TaxID=2803861 RepID=A0ABS1TFR9_9CLOT|nr:TrkA family potassium uptake protein [Clostridium rhizosphaerae]MBL4938165.1 TrkA family potassium uptake protein [Clostridium rhizosphaerae]
MRKKQFVVIGLGNFGSSVARTLYSLGNEVLAVDSEEAAVREIADYVTHAAQVDTSDEKSLKELGISNFDVAVIGIGSDIQASIMATLIVKELGVKYIISKAHDERHAKLLYKIGADRVVFVERDMGVRVAHNIFASNILDYIELSPDYNIAEIAAPEEWYGKTLKEIDVRLNYGLSVIAIKKNHDVNIAPKADDIIREQDVVIAIGDNKELNKFENLFGR